MCLIVLAVHPDPEHRLVLVANRDERYARSTRPATEWEEIPGLVGGRDLHGGGTWLGATRAGRFAALTNYHDATPPRPDAPSRGHLVAGFLAGETPPEEYLRELAAGAADYNGFNLLVGDASGTYWYSNRAARGAVPLTPGVYGLSNHLLDTPWPKVVGAKRRLESLLTRTSRPDPAHLLDLLHDRSVVEAQPGEAPLSEWERALSAAFIVTPEYGTRSTTALLLRHAGGGMLAERTYHRGDPQGREVRLAL